MTSSSSFWPPSTHLLVALCISFAAISHAFSPSTTYIIAPRINSANARQIQCLSQIVITPTASSLQLSPNNKENLGVIDLTDDDDEEEEEEIVTLQPASNNNNVAPFLSQGELSDDPNLLSPDFKNPKQTRVIIYIILTLVPILFLVPLMIGSRDLIPLDVLPPVELN
jgi:hypothetical protein